MRYRCCEIARRYDKLCFSKATPTTEITTTKTIAAPNRKYMADPIRPHVEHAARVPRNPTTREAPTTGSLGCVSHTLPHRSAIGRSCQLQPAEPDWRRSVNAALDQPPVC